MVLKLKHFNFYSCPIPTFLDVLQDCDLIGVQFSSWKLDNFDDFLCFCRCQGPKVILFLLYLEVNILSLYCEFYV